MASKTRKIGIVLMILANLALVAIWAVNGYEETWFYVTLILLSISTSLINFGKNNKEEQK